MQKCYVYLIKTKQYLHKSLSYKNITIYFFSETIERKQGDESTIQSSNIEQTQIIKYIDW